MASLAEAQGKLKAVQDKLAVLEANYTAAVDKKNALQADVDLTNLKLGRADKLLGGLGGERSKWKETVATLKNTLANLIGNVVVAAGGIAYLGVFTAKFREDLVKQWQECLVETNVPVDIKTATLRGTLEVPVKVRQWQVEGLPSDSLSIENAICMDKARRWPLCIDPQRQANRWIKAKEKEGLGEDGCVKASDSGGKLQRALENAVRFGRTLLLENVMQSLDPSLEPILLKQTFKQGGSLMIKLGDSVIAYDPNFKFYLTTNLRNPHYTPEVSVKVSILNFLITPDGLEEQLLGVLVSNERPDCEEKKNELVINNARMSKELTDLEDNILALLEKSGADILDEDTLINALADSKVLKDEITVQMDAAAITEKEIDEAREKYRPCAYRSQLIFFCVADLAGVDPMYQYSLQWFKVIFVNTLLNSERADDFDARIQIINDHFTYSTYDNVCRGLFEQHKLIFSLTLAVKLLQGYDLMDLTEWRFLLAGPTGTDTELPNPAPHWITNQIWIEFSKVSLLEKFNGLDVDVAANGEFYESVFDSDTPQDMPIPEAFKDKWDTFQQMLFLRCIRPDKLVPLISRFVTEQMKKKFVTPPVFDLSVSYSQATCTMPLIFILSPGSDPTENLFKFSETMSMRAKTFYISLGQGQGPKAEKMINDGCMYGNWVLLQNCHLYKSWMSILEKMVENFGDENNRDFRLWLTSLPSEHFPVSILENGVKIVNEPPAGMKANLNQTYVTMGQDFLDRSRNPMEWRKCLFGLCLFHAVVLERRKFGPLGFNISYGFTQGDCDVGKEQLKLLLDDYDTLPFKVIRVLVTDVNYGGRVTDDWDRRFMSSMIDIFQHPDMFDNEYAFSASGCYKSVEANKIDDYLEAIEQFPDDAAPEAFGFHSNAEITCATDQANQMLASILALQPRTAAGGGKSREDIIDELAVDVSQRVEGPYDMEPVMKMHPVIYTESMNTVLQQEIVRYNKLLAEMKRSLADIRKALVGQLVMTDELDAMGTAMYNQQIPGNWQSKSYPSLMPFAAWVNDLLKRLEFLNKWIEFGIPVSFWISGFFFPQGFLVGTLQNYARKYQKPIDTINFETVVLRCKSQAELTEKPEDGCYIWGLFMEGARWNADEFCLDESEPKVLFTEMVPMHLVPTEGKAPIAPGASASSKSLYAMPVYKILTRAGVLSTTGHSTNYVCPLEIPTKKDPEHWIRRGVALFTMLRF